MNIYYKSNKNGLIVTEAMIHTLERHFGHQAMACITEVDEYVKMEEPPSVVDCINADSIDTAVYRYRELHTCSVKDAYAAIKNMRMDIIKVRRRQNKKKK